MTALAANVAIGATTLVADGPLDEVPVDVKLDDELLRVGGQHIRVGSSGITDLALADGHAAMATHTAGTTIQPVLDAYTQDFTSPFSSGSGEQTIRLLGPFTVAHDTPDIETDGVALGDPLPTGVIVLALIAYVTEGWVEIPTSMDLGLVNGPASGGDTAGPLTIYNDINADPGVGWAELEFARAPDIAVETALIVGDDVRVWCRVDVVSTAGEANIYALIAEPA